MKKKRKRWKDIESKNKKEIAIFLQIVGSKYVECK